MSDSKEKLPANYTICAYIRLSLEDDDISGFKVESGSITSQRKLIMDYISKQPEFARCNVIERCDDGFSGTKFDNRPQFTDMINLCRQGRINCIIVKDCSRFGRDYVELGDYLEQVFPFLGIRFISINDNYDSDRDEAGLDIAFKNLVYDFYARDLSKKARISAERRAKQGKYRGSQTVYGYRKSEKDKTRLEIDPEAAEIVKEIFHKRLAGIGNTEIARILNARGVPCPTAYQASKGRPVSSNNDTDMMNWTGAVVNGLLHHEVYTGTMVGLKHTIDRQTGKVIKRPESELVRVEGTHEAIISKEEFDAVAELMKDVKISKKYKHSTRFYCGCCGKRLAKRKKIFFCRRDEMFYDDTPCRDVKIDRAKANDILLNELKAKLKRVLDEEEMLLKRKKEMVPAEYQIKEAEGRLADLSLEKKYLFDKLADRNIDREEFKAKKAELDRRISEAEERISDLRAADDFSGDGDTGKTHEIRSFLDVTEMTDEIMARFVKRVTVYPGDKLEIQWNFDE